MVVMVTMAVCFLRRMRSSLGFRQFLQYLCFVFVVLFLCLRRPFGNGMDGGGGGGGVGGGGAEYGEKTTKRRE